MRETSVISISAWMAATMPPSPTDSNLDGPHPLDITARVTFYTKAQSSAKGKKAVADDFGYVCLDKGKRVSERRWYLPSTTRRQVTRNALNNSGEGTLTIVPLYRELSGTGDHTRKAMEVKRTRWVNYGRYRRSFILLVSTAWLILKSSTMTQRVTRPVLLLVLLLWWVIRTHH